MCKPKCLKAVFRSPVFYIALVFLWSFSLFLLSGASIRNVSLTRDGNAEKTALPFLIKLNDNELFTVDFDVVHSGIKSYGMKIVPDDCVDEIFVNDVSLPLKSVNGRCDYTKGFRLNEDILKSVVHDGVNHFQFKMHNGGGPGGLNVQFTTTPSVLSLFELILAILTGSILFLWLLGRCKVNLGLSFVLLAGVLLRILLFSNLLYSQYAYDVNGHLDYVKYVAENNALPQDTTCWSCYHPPLYYVTAAVAWDVGEAMEVSKPRAVQFYSMLLSFAMLLIGFLVLRKVLAGFPLFWATLLWTLWPLCNLLSTNIGNDQLFFVGHMLCLWASLCYLKERRGGYMVVAALACFVAEWSKSTGSVTMGVFALTLLLGYFPRQSLKPTKSEVVSCVLFLLLIASIVVHRVFGDPSLVGNINTLHSGLKVGNAPGNFLYFDLKDFLMHPFTSSWSDEGGRQYFWNYALKTSLFGEFTLSKNELGRNLATIVGVSYLVMLGYGLRGFWKNRVNKACVILLAQSVAFFAALMVLRYKFPYSCSNDFRYILPVLVTFIPFIVMGVSDKALSVKTRAVGYVSVLAFVVCSVSLLLML